MNPRILLIEDEPGLVLTLTDRLLAECYTVDSRTDGESGLAAALEAAHDLILLDLMLPRKSGLDICRALRRQDIATPILMLTARGQLVDKVVGLQLGADDYLTKPFEFPELMARIQALLRRAGRNGAPATPATFGFGGATVDFRAGQVTRGGQSVPLSAREFQLLRYLIERRGTLITREELLREVWGYDALPTTRTVDVHVTWLRQKVEDDPRHPRFILTLRGLGYKFSA
ncbi:MAG: response regulator transcription factor [Bryobacterales bacterium]|nr:response regulator transcription factor [Bryobacterales bacterium]